MSNMQQQNTQPGSYGTGPVPGAPAPQPKNKSRAARIGWAVLAVFVVFLAGYGIGNSGPAPAAKPEVKTETQTVTVTETPASCAEALTAADTVIATAGEGFNITAEAMDAAASFDADGIETATEKLTNLNKEQLTPQLEAYKTARELCKAER